jgi:serine/threonine-protein kinase
MGVVYKAEDMKLKRTVALKFLPPELTRDKDAKTRFIHEAQAASALQHHNICAIHDIGETDDGHMFIVMDCYDGETLKEKIARGPLAVDEAIDIVSQVAEGLAKAHATGMVHRDIKPANIMITSDGVVKILDFGLAKLAGQTKVTKTGTTVGTVAYMSPEQARGDETDSRSDIWPLGVVLYEMMRGRLPFRGEVEPAMLYAIMNEDPEPVMTLRGDVPHGVEAIIEKALAKERARRYGTMDEFLSDLEAQRDQITLGIKQRRFRAMRGFKRRKRLTTGAVTIVALVAAVVLVQVFHNGDMTIDSIAVLPLEDLSGDPAQEYFADGMTDALIAELTKIGALDVISRTSVMRYKETDKPLPQIARELGVTVVVEGSVLRDGERVRITAQLIHASTDRHLWADNYDRDFGDILILTSEVARAIAHEIQVILTPREQLQLAGARPVNPVAHDLYLKGKYYYYKATKEGDEKAINYLQQAIEADSNYAPAYARLAAAYMWYSYDGHLSPEETYPICSRLIEKALEIDDTLAEAHMVLAGVKYHLDWDWVGADAEYKRALELDPNLGEYRGQYAFFLLATGRFEEAIAEAERTLHLDPVALWPNKNLSYMYYHARQYEQAVLQWQQMIDLELDVTTAYRGLVRTYEAMGRYEDAVKFKKKVFALWGEPSQRIAALDSTFSESGPKGYWMWHLERLTGEYDRYPILIAMYYAQLGERDQAFAWLEKAYEKHAGQLFLLKVDPLWDPLRDDSRYHDMLRRVGFPES